MHLTVAQVVVERDRHAVADAAGVDDRVEVAMDGRRHEAHEVAEGQIAAHALGAGEVDGEREAEPGQKLHRGAR